MDSLVVAHDITLNLQDNFWFVLAKAYGNEQFGSYHYPPLASLTAHERESPRGGAVASGIGIWCDAISSIPDSTRSGSEVNWLIARLCCKRLRAVNLAH